jgi:hypothetical protein
MRYSVATPPPYMLENVIYAQAISLHVGGSDAILTEGKGEENAPPTIIPLPLLETAARMRPSHIRRSEIKICK